VTARTWMLAVGAAAMLVPAALAVLVFPTAMLDTAELFAWGRFFPLATHKHPPMMALVGGLVELVLPANAISAILVGQALNAIGVLYLYLLLMLVVDRERALLFAFLFATSIYFMVAPLSYALNADILQVPIWLAILYHVVVAVETDRLRHWLAFGAWSAAAVLTKYSAGILFVAGGLACVVLPEYRRIWRNPRFYLAAIVGIVLLSPHLIALRDNPQALRNAEAFTIRAPDLAARLESLLLFVGGTLMFLAPGWIIVGGGFVAGNCTIDRDPVSPAVAARRRFFRVVCLAAVAICVALVVVLGTVFNHRYGAPLFGIFVLALAPWVKLRAETWPAARRAVILYAGLTAATVLLASASLYGFFTGHDYMQEPAEEAARIMRDTWDKRYTCGPAYFLGDRASAHGLSLADDRHPAGIPLEDLAVASWFDPALLGREGAIVAFRTPVPVDLVESALPGTAIASEDSFALPLLRTLTGATITYHYFFVPPRSCAIASPPG
jgi:4-amino-4-deoxy-L-arabinose transferase-like glycosyltransferase